MLQTSDLYPDAPNSQVLGINFFEFLVKVLLITDHHSW